MTARSPAFGTPGGLEVKAGVYANEPVVFGHWGPQGFGFSTSTMRAVARWILDECDEADAMAARQDGESDGR